MKSQLMKSFIASLVFAIMFSGTLSARPSVTVDHSSKEAICESFILALSHQDHEAFRQLFLPQQLNEIARSQNISDSQAATTLLKFLSDKGCAVLIYPFSQNVVQLKKEAKRMATYKESPVVQSDGKWFLDLKKLLDDVVKNPPKLVHFEKIPPVESISHDSKLELLETLLIAQLNCDVDLVWDAYSPSLRLLFIQKFTSERKAKRFLKKQLRSMLTEDVKLQYTICLSEPHRQEKLQGAVKSLEQRNAFENIDGKWYVNMNFQ